MIISHRGYLDGPDKDRENNPLAIKECIEKGFYVEADVRFEDGGLYLGHDKPLYKIEESFLKEHRDKLIIHAKTMRTATAFFPTHGYHWFLHELDRAVLTSWKWLWLFPGEYHRNGIVSDFNNPFVSSIQRKPCAGICTDYPLEYERRKNEQD